MRVWESTYVLDVQAVSQCYTTLNACYRHMHGICRGLKDLSIFRLTHLTVPLIPKQARVLGACGLSGK